jgi:DNA-directed RNA polymerase III subunit RPC3
VERVAAGLAALAAQRRPTAPVRVVDAAEELPPALRSFRLDYSLASEAVQLRTVESIVAERYDLHAARMVRMLLERGMLDEKAIADKALFEPKRARALLFRMVSDGLLTTQELSRRPNDHNPQHTIYLFNAHWDRLLAVLAESTCRAVLFMRVRERMERARLAAARRDGLALLTGLSAVGAGAAAREAALVSRMEEGVYKLEASIVRIDETLFVLAEL